MAQGTLTARVVRFSPWRAARPMRVQLPSASLYRTMRVLFCIYTCKKHAKPLQEFKETPAYEFVSKHKAFEVVDVYADGSLTEPVLANGILTLPCEDAYPHLPIKTYLMLKYGVEHFDCDFIVKCDCTILRRDNYHPRKLLEFIRSKNCYSRDYNGVRLLAMPEGAIRAWMKNKGLRGAFRAIYPNRSHSFPFFGGKLYITSREFSRFIVRHGEKLAGKYAKYLPGAEDQMVGMLYHYFNR